MANSALISLISLTCQSILSVMKEYKRRFTYADYVELDGFVSCKYNGKYYAFDSLYLAKDGSICAYDFRQHQISLMSKYGAEYFDCSIRDFYEEEIYARHYEGVGVLLEYLDEQTLTEIKDNLESVLMDFTTRFPLEDEAQRQMQEEYEAKMKFINSLPFMERYYIQQYGMDAWRKAFKH